jgi:hypothetical protein
LVRKASPGRMRTLLGAALEVQTHLTTSNERFCFIGGIAVQRWGEPRLTRDVDATVLCPYGNEGAFADRMFITFPPRIADAREFALRNRVLLLETRGRVPVDIALGGIPFEERCVERASNFELARGTRLLTCSAEDLIVLKAFAARARDWLDIESVIARRGDKIDWRLVFEELAPLAAARDAPEIVARLRQMTGTTN